MTCHKQRKVEAHTKGTTGNLWAPCLATRSQSLAMSSPQAAPAPQQPESPESIPAQEESPSPEWIHEVTNLLSHPITSEIGQRIKKWVFYQGIPHYTNLVITWDPIEFGETESSKNMKILMVTSPISSPTQSSN